LIVFFVPHEIANELQIEYAIPLTRAMSHYREIKNATAEVVGVRLVKKTSTARAHAAIRDVIVANPTLSYQQIANLLGCSGGSFTGSPWSSALGEREVQAARRGGRNRNETHEVF
jgi:hypothetical protein